MEERNDVEKVDIDNVPEEKAESSKSRRKSLKEKIVTAALVGGLLTSSGCAVSKGPEQKNTEPMNPDPIEEVDESKDEIDLEEKEVAYPSLVETNDSYQINLSSNIHEYINEMYSAENEVLKYPVFDVKEGQDHTEIVENFVFSITGQEIERQKPLPLDPSYSKWETNEGFFSYSSYNNLLEMEFSNPLSLNDLEINMESKESVQEGLEKLSSKFFDENFEYRVDEIIKEGDFYKVNYSRLLEGAPVYQINYPLYLILSPDGKVKGGRFWLREFEKTGEVSLLSGSEFAENINKKEYPKSVSFTAPGLIQTGAESDFFPHHYDISLPKEKGAGSIDLNEAELVYYYRFHSEESLVLPMFRLKGEGIINPDVMFTGDEKTRDASFEVLTNAMDSKYLEDFSTK